ncbi:MAG: aldo/keto reductase [Chloroflexi bacterium]|jgi:aryl-alcohol dehydrogenase-like predicted oxidoreductase|nr:aldo/keto reductase [Chloroflexota bacterium]
MRYVEIDGMRVSRIGLGAWQFGSREWGYGETYARETAPALVLRAIELGITMIDTAEAYGPGRSERIIRDALEPLPPDDRDGLVIATKFMPIAPAEPIVAWQAGRSRRRLGVDAIDLYYAHWPNPFVSPRRTMQSVRPLLAAGHVRRVGVSNHSLAAWRAAERALRAPVVANQVRFSLESPGPLRDLVPHAAASGRLVVAYSPLAQGILARDGASAPEAPQGGFRSRDPRFRAAGDGRIAPLREALHDIAAAHGATLAQVALAWLLAHPATVAIPGARTLAQLEENAAAADLDLAPEEVARLTVVAEERVGSRGRQGARIGPDHWQPSR